APSVNPEQSARPLAITGSGESDHVAVSVVPEKEGILGFKHVNYQLTSARKASQVVRRYSDFVWLSASLLSRYPYRTIPLLPPKRFALNGHYLAAGNSFIEQRRRGLSRFINAVIRHPALKNEYLVIMFLTVPADLSLWRKQTSVSIQEEFLGSEIPTHYESLIPKDLESRVEILKRELSGALDTYVTLCHLFENLITRKRSCSSDYKRISMSLGRLSGYPLLCSVPGTNGVSPSLSYTSKTFLKITGLLDDESHAWDQGILQDLKMERDIIISLRQVFERRDKDVDKITGWERHIDALVKKIAIIKERKEPPKEGEIENLEHQIAKNKQAVIDEKKRNQLIRLCLKEELTYFQARQVHVGKMLQEYATERVRHAQLQVDSWNILSKDLASAPSDSH
ncbi:Sorting nexin mvp1, partial [Neolecta irregularis DAH-3]